MALAKYPWLFGENAAKPAKWGAYDCDLDALDWVGHGSSPDLHAQIMDWADDVAYVTHDLEDYFRLGLLPLNEYVTDESLSADFLAYVKGNERLHAPQEDWARPFEQIIALLMPRRRFRGYADDHRALETLRSGLHTFLISGTSIGSDGNLYIDSEVRVTAELLKQMIWYHIIDNPDLALQQSGQRQVIRRVFQKFEDLIVGDLERFYDISLTGSSHDAPMRQIPSRLARYLNIGWRMNRNYNKQSSAYRAILDYLSSLDEGSIYHTDLTIQGAQEKSGLGTATFLT
jgi:dGTPase